MEERYETILRTSKEDYEFYFFFNLFYVVVKEIKEYSLKQLIDNDYVIL